jgi:SAM-dependent methyltransferase
MFGPRRHQNLADALGLEGGEVVLDFGCGAGDTLGELVSRPNPPASAVGLDLRSDRLASALARDDRVRAVVANLNDGLPLRSSVGDAAISYNTLECLVNRDAFLAEVGRVLKPGAPFLLGHADFDTMVFNSSDLDFTRRLIHAYADTTEEWMGASDGTMGRKLVEIARGSRFSIVQTFAWVGAHTTFAPGSPARVAAEALVGMARRDPDLAPTVDGWFQDLQARDRAGSFFFSINDYAVLLKREDDR